MTKHPKFFCENCKSEVRHDAMICPHCGRFFSSVRCPACSFTGTHKEFKDGCPACGYAFGADTSIIPLSGHKSMQHSATVKKNETDADPLPFWVYGLVASLAITMGIIFFMNY